MNRSWVPKLAQGITLFAAATFLLASHAMAQINGYTSVGLQWTAGGDDGTVGRASLYELRYSTADPAADVNAWWTDPSTKVASGLPFPSSSGITDSTRVTGLTPGTHYYFVIRARDDGGNESAFSNIAEWTTPACNVPAAAPTQFQVAEDTGAALLGWDAATDPLATTLHIYRATGNGSFSLLTARAPTETSYRDATVLPGTTYRYRAAWASACADGPSTGDTPITMSGTAPTAGSQGGSIHAYPNPSSGIVNISVQVKSSFPSPVELGLFDLNGHRVADLASATMSPGASTISWDRTSRGGNPVAPGYYEIIGTVDGARVRERIVLLP